MSDFGAFCKGKNCEQFIEWDYSFDEECAPYPCESCRLVGQSYTVDKYPYNCIHITDITIYEAENFNATTPKEQP